MTSPRFQVVGENLVGRGLSFDVAAIGLTGKSTPAQIDALVDVAEAVYRQGRDVSRLPYDDRFDLSLAAEALRALSVLVGPCPTGDRWRRSADVIARLLGQENDP